jgi:hypothetical protein
MKPIKQSVINTFNRVGIEYEYYLGKEGEVEVQNRFGGGNCMTTPLIAECIAWVYRTNDAFDNGNYIYTIADFDRVRMFILEQDSKAYSTCID